MKVLHVIERFYPLIGGAEIQALQLIKKLKAKGIEIDVLTRKVDGNLSDFGVFDGIPVYRLEPKGLKASKFMFAWNVYKFIKKRDYDIIHVHGIYSIFGMGCILAGKKVIGKLTNSIGKHKQNKIIRTFKLSVLRKIDKIIAISNQIKLEIYKMGFDTKQIITIPNGVDTHKFKPDSKKKFKRLLKLPKDKIIAIFCGKLIQEKGLDILLKAMISIVKDFPQLLLLVCGAGKHREGDLESDLKKTVQECSLNKNVQFVGDVFNMPDYFKAADIFIFPSRREGLPNALLEAISSGLPTIASNIGGNIDIIKDNYNGLLFESENEKELAEKIVVLVKDKKMQRKFSKHARTTAVKNFSLDIVCEDYFKLYKSLVS